MKLKSSWILVGLLVLGVVFLMLDNCGDTAKYNKLKGEYQTYYDISRKVVATSIAEIHEQDKEIVKLAKKITYLHGIIEVKDADLADKEEELGELKREFADLEECQQQYDKLVEAFTLCKSIVVDKDSVIFNLNKKYEAQVVISLNWEKMYKSVRPLIDIHLKQVKELENINRRLKLTSKLKTGIVVAMAGVVLYSLLRK
jgi:DNA repair exonuclease SbcCD ATPase subunit